jgi:hypothetical protein
VNKHDEFVWALDEYTNKDRSPSSLSYLRKAHHAYQEQTKRQDEAWLNDHVKNLPPLHAEPTVGEDDGSGKTAG